MFATPLVTSGIATGNTEGSVGKEMVFEILLFANEGVEIGVIEWTFGCWDVTVCELEGTEIIIEFAVVGGEEEEAIFLTTFATDVGDKTIGWASILVFI